MPMHPNHPRSSGLAQPRKSVQNARRSPPPPPLPDAARRPRRDVGPPPPRMAQPLVEVAIQPTMMPSPLAMQRPMPLPVYRDDLDATVVKAIARPTPLATKVEAPPLQEDPLSPATEARAAKTASSRRRANALSSSRDALRSALKRLASDYRELSTAKRLLIPVTIILFFAAAPSSSRAGETAKHTAAPAVTAAAPPRAAPPPATSPAASTPGVVLPSARALAPSSQTALSPEERRQYDRAISATLGGDFDSAEAIYTRLAAAHPESAELTAAARVLAAKKKRKAAR